MQSCFFCIQTPFMVNPTLNLYNTDSVTKNWSTQQLLFPPSSPCQSYPFQVSNSGKLKFQPQYSSGIPPIHDHVPTNQPTVKEVRLHRVHRGKFSIRTLLYTTAFINDCLFSTTLIQRFGGPSCLSKVLLVPGKMQSL